MSERLQQHSIDAYAEDGFYRWRCLCGAKSRSSLPVDMPGAEQDQYRHSERHLDDSWRSLLRARERRRRRRATR